MASKAKKLCQRNQTFPGELSPELEEKYISLVEALRKTYRMSCRRVQPVAFLQDQCCCVNDIFVESKIEVIDNTKSDEDPGKWSTIKSRHEIFTESSGERYITIEGQHGFGKSTLLMQYAYDWYTTSPMSPLKDIDIFVLLHLKNFINGSSITDEIRMTLSGDVRLSSKDIEDVITSGHWKVLLAIDGYYKNLTDISQVLSSRVLSDCKIVIAITPKFGSSFEDKRLPDNMKHYVLRGFDQHMQEEYIEKVATFKVRLREDRQRAIELLRRNINLSSLCQVPFFCAAFFHSICFDKGEQELSNHVTINSVTCLLNYVVACFFNRPKNTENRIRWSKSNSKEDPMQRMLISKLAFDGLMCASKKGLWAKADLVEELGPECYSRYVTTGILLEEEKRTLDLEADNKLVVTTFARFVNKEFQEFYAAWHIVDLATHQEADEVVGTLIKLAWGYPEYVLQFVYALNPIGAKVVQKYLRVAVDIGKYFAILCPMEQQDGDIDEKLAELCAQKSQFYGRDNCVEVYTIKLLQRASERNIPISKVCLVDCKTSIHLREDSLFFSRVLQIPILDTLQVLVIHVWFRGSCDLRVRFKDILEYSLRCIKLKTIKFTTANEICRSYFLLPWSFDDKDILTRLQQKRCKVMWVQERIWVLNLESGKWEKEEDGKEMTESDYQRVIDGETRADEKEKQSLSVEARRAIAVRRLHGASRSEINYLTLRMLSLQKR